MKPENIFIDADGKAPMVGVARDSEGQVIGVLPLVLEGSTAHFAGSGLGDRFEPAAHAVDREVRPLAFPPGGEVVQLAAR